MNAIENTEKSNMKVG